MLEVSDGPRFGIETHTMVYLVLDAPFVPRNAQIRTRRACRQLSPGYNESSLKGADYYSTILLKKLQ